MAGRVRTHGRLWAALALLGLLAPFAAPPREAGAAVERHAGRLKDTDRRLNSGEFYDEFTVDVVPGEDLSVRLLSDDFDPYLIVQPPISARGHEQEDNDDWEGSSREARIEIEGAAPGTWEILVTSETEGATGRYELVVETRPASSMAPGGAKRFEGALEPSDPRLEQGEHYDSYPLELEPGQRVVVDLTGEAFDTYVGLVSPSGRTFANDDWENAASRSRLDVTVDESGTWEVLVTSFAPNETGAYVLDVLIVPAGETELAPGAEDGRIQGALQRGDESLASGELYDEYSLVGEAGEYVVIDVTSRSFDTYLMLRPPEGDQTWDNDDHAGDMRRSQLALHLPMDGVYTVYVTSAAAGEQGAYLLRIQRPELDEGPATGSGARTERGALAEGDDALETGELLDVFELEGAPGRRVTIDLRSAAFDTYLILRPPAGRSLESDDWRGDSQRSRIEAELSEAGTYLIGVTSYAPGEMGEYELVIDVTEVSTSPFDRHDLTPLASGEPQRGVLEAGDLQLENGELADLYAFEGRVGERVDVRLASEQFDTYLALIDPEGNIVRNDDDEGRRDASRIQLDLRATGRYRVVVTSYAAGEQGTYAVVLALAPASRRPTAPPPSTSGGGTARVYGVFVGIRDYPGDDQDLVYCDEDAQRIHDTLQTVYGMRAEDAVLLLNEEATLDHLRAAIRYIGPRVGPNDIFVFFYSGHGDREQRTEFQRADPLGWDETLVLLDEEMVDDELDHLLESVAGGTTLVVIDACFSGGFSKDVISKPGRMGLFSSHEDVLSAVADKFRAGGYLSRFLADALGADRDRADADGDRALSAIELSQYVYERYREDVREGKSTPKNDEPVFVSTDRNLGYQQLVVDRGGVSPRHILFRW